VQNRITSLLWLAKCGFIRPSRSFVDQTAVYSSHFVAILSTVAISFAILFLIVGVTTVYKSSPTKTVTFAVSILVAWVPEGLPSIVTLLLSIAAGRMAQQNVLVKDLRGVETLGALTLLATDKTGTLTRNQMTVTNLWSSLRMVSAFSSNNDSADTETFDIGQPGMKQMVDVAILNSRIKFDKVDIPFDEREILGDATETGLARFGGKYVSDYDKYHAAYPKAFEIPFNSANKWALTVVGPYFTSIRSQYLSFDSGKEDARQWYNDLPSQGCSRTSACQMLYLPERRSGGSH
jgi:sodium/potassium-transporting ATPase subunit alpha